MTNPSKPDATTAFRLRFAFFNARADRTTDMEGPHRKLRARLTNTLGSDDADGHTFLNHRTCRHVHAVAPSTNAQWCIAGHRASNLNPFQTKLFDTIVAQGSGATGQAINECPINALMSQTWVK